MNTVKENSKAAFNQQAATYDKDIKGQHARSLYPVLLEKLSHIPFQSALDLGCGTGENAKNSFCRKIPIKNCAASIYQRKCLLLRNRNSRNKSSYCWGTARHSLSRTTPLMLCTATTLFIIILHRKMC
mgnify:CR=1 FL=1